MSSLFVESATVGEKKKKAFNWFVSTSAEIYSPWFGLSDDSSQEESHRSCQICLVISEDMLV